MRLSDTLFVIGGGDAGFGLSGSIDSNVYALSTSEGIWLIDVGLNSFDMILSNARADGLEPADITRVFITHSHADHAGALAQLRRALPHVLISVAHDVADEIGRGDETANSLARARELGYYPADFSLEPCVVDDRVRDGWQVTAGETTITAIETPGHCHGHLCFHVNDGAGGLLFSGDQVFVGGQILLQNIPDCDLQACAQSMSRLAELEFDALLPGHLMISMTNGKRHVDHAAQVFSRLGVPKNVI